MKYRDMVKTREGYHPVFDLENESPKSWKAFIPNDNFDEVLSTVLNSIEPSSHVKKCRHRNPAEMFDVMTQGKQ